MNALALAIALLPCTSQDFDLARNFKQGESDSYRIDMNVGMMIGELNIKMDLAQTVKQVFAAGDAEVQSDLKNLKILLNGNPLPGEVVGQGSAQIPSFVQRFDRYMRPVGTTGNSGGMLTFLSLLQLTSMMGGQPMKIGEKMPIDFENKESKTKITGHFTIVEIKNGVARIDADARVLNAQTGDKPINLKSTSHVQIADAKPKKIEGTITGVPASGSMQIDAIRFTMERA